jgi:GT2 family glycosyltransferase
MNFTRKRSQLLPKTRSLKNDRNGATMGLNTDILVQSQPTSRAFKAGMLPRVSIIVVNWNGCHHLGECLDSLSAQTFRDFEVVLVDNGSSDGSLALVRACYPTVKILPLAENTGFARGNNLGFAQAQGEYLVTLNNDTRTEPGWLAALVAAADADPRIGMVGSRIGSYADPDCLDSIGVAICPDGMSRGAFRQRRFSTLGLSGVIDILLPSACAALYRRAMLDEVGGFDEDFFAYCEDTDLGLRGRLAGWRAVAALDAMVRHKYSQTGGALSPFKLRLVERNHYWVALKCFPLSLLCLLPLTTAGRFYCQGRAFFRGSWRRPGENQSGGTRTGTAALLVALVQGCVEAAAGLAKMTARRRQLQRMQRLSARDVKRLIRQYSLTFRQLFDDAP